MSDSLHNFDTSPLILSLQVAGVATLLESVGLGWLFARHRFPGSMVLASAAARRTTCRLPVWTAQRWRP